MPTAWLYCQPVAQQPRTGTEDENMKGNTAILLLSAAVLAGISGCSRTVTYAEVEPMLLDKCASCHTGDQEGVVKSGFSVESYDSIMKGTNLGPVVVAGSAESSTLFRMVAGKTDPEIHMPQAGDSLGDDQIEIVRKWIDQGAGR
jgi:hypothetical protein